MRFGAFTLGAAVLSLVPAPALAGDKVLEAKAPAWVEEATLDTRDLKGKPAELIADYQYRLENGVVYSYYDRAQRIDNSQALMDENTVSLSWQPDKGDLTVHRLEIYRDGKVIDLLADGAKFDVIRREQGLEDRLLDGSLTATLSIPGLRIGDVLRTSYSTSVHDQALGDEVQVLQYLGSAPWRVAMGRAIVSWPQDMPIRWKSEAESGVGAPQVHDGYRYLTVKLPLPEAKAMPDDAPSRFGRDTVLRVGSFADWNELSSVMAPLFLKASDVEPGGAVAKQAQAIMKQSPDPLTRAALATRLVQDQVSYLLNGLDGGNYIPQDAEFTWGKRYGDCKAKSVLLLALLKQMGIEAEPVLVASSGGDALPELLPVPGDFDHVIVHALIGGTDYWLDGTNTGTRLYNLADVPPFYYALPLKAGGADLMPMAMRDKAYPDIAMSGTIDQSAGIDLPQLFSIKVDISGPSGIVAERLADTDDPKLLRRMASAFTQREGFEGGAISSIRASYDKEKAIGHVMVEGVAPSSFHWQDGRFVVDADPSSTEDFDFNPDRSRPEWRDVPVLTRGPTYATVDFSMILPEHGKGFALRGGERLEARVANTRIVADTTLSDGIVHGKSQVWQALGEVAPGDVAEAKLAARKLKANVTALTAPTQATWRWQLDEKQLRAKVAPILAAFDKAIAFALDDDFVPMTQKAEFLETIYDYPGALALYDKLVEHAPTADNHLRRARVLRALGRRPDAIDDLQAAYSIDPANSTAFSLAQELAYAGKIDEALDLLGSLPIRDADRTAYAETRATVVGLKGDSTTALTLLADAVANKPENSDVLNADCWFRGLFNVALDSAVGQCTHAIERADQPYAALDSRALVEYRLGDYDAALADLNAVLKIAPGIPASRYMRGVTRLKKGDKGGREDIETALRMSPSIAEFYARHGVSPTT